MVIMDPDKMIEADRKLLKIDQNTLGGMCQTKEKVLAAEVETSRSAKRKEHVRQRNPVHSGVVHDTGTEIVQTTYLMQKEKKLRTSEYASKHETERSKEEVNEGKCSSM